MTRNQIAFAEHKENVRHNRATESQTDATLRETSRHNIASEGISSGTLSESVRHNKASEAVNWYTAQQLSYLQQAQAELARQNALFVGPNAASLRLQAEAALSQADASQSNAMWRGFEVTGAQQDQANASLSQARTAQANSQELHRHNVVTEIEQGVNSGANLINAVSNASKSITDSARNAAGLAALIGG
nr:putative ORF1 [Marmot picobirnavirus]